MDVGLRKSCSFLLGVELIIGVALVDVECANSARQTLDLLLGGWLDQRRELMASVGLWRLTSIAITWIDFDLDLHLFDQNLVSVCS